MSYIEERPYVKKKFKLRTNTIYATTEKGKKSNIVTREF